MSQDQNSSIAELLARARQGDESARERLFARCRSYVGVVAQAQVENWMQAKIDASDLIQQTLLEAHRGFQGFQGATEGEWLAWLRRILSHNATDFVRQYCGTAKRQLRRERPLQAATDDDSRRGNWEPPAGTETPSRIAIRRECELEVAEALERLPPDYREVIMLRNLQRLPFDEVARRMGRSRPATQMLWMRALRKLQESMKADPYAVA